MEIHRLGFTEREERQKEVPSPRNRVRHFDKKSYMRYLLISTHARKDLVEEESVCAEFWVSVFHLERVNPNPSSYKTLNIVNAEYQNPLSALSWGYMAPNQPQIEGGQFDKWSV